ncbi:MAG: anthranilate phosphoribosyltransferase [Desulfobacteraceae bacterium]|nr:anthranilate phosphoribosyltransferase [Desulfobacteraceae bacterium]
MEQDRAFGAVITRLIQKQDLTRTQAKDAFVTILTDKTTPMQQGAFLAALAAKGETEHEVAAGWEAIYNLDTCKVSVKTATPVVENSGTGMDTFKTFNISTAASLIAASQGIPMARHGARAITSACGTVDMVEALGIHVECGPELVAQSIETAGIGLFNGMSPQIHPMALGRILSQIYFGSTLNIAASLANPALPKLGVRGVYSREMVLPVARVMKEIGYERAIVVHGSVFGTDLGMDEASVCGTTFCAELSLDGDIREYSFAPNAFGMGDFDPSELTPDTSCDLEARRFVKLLRTGDGGARAEAAILNAALIFYIAGMAKTLDKGVALAAKALRSGAAFDCLERWVGIQTREPEAGIAKLRSFI